MTITKILIAIAVLIVVAFGVAFGVSRYLVSKLDGTGGVQTPQQTLQQYASEDGVSFKYPDSYELASHTVGTSERQWDVLVLLPKGYVAPQGGEGPPAITMSVFQNPEALGLEAWVKGDARSNYKLSQDGAMTAGRVGGEEALFYNHSGLYEFDAVAVKHDGKIFLFEAGFDDQANPIRSDFSNLIKTVQFD